VRGRGFQSIDRVSLHQTGEDQEGFFRFFEREVLPKL